MEEADHLPYKPFEQVFGCGDVIENVEVTQHVVLTLNWPKKSKSLSNSLYQKPIL